MPPKLVRLCARVDEGTKFFVVLCLAVALTLAFTQSANAEMMRRFGSLKRTSNEIKLSRIFLTATLPQGTVGTIYNGALGVRGGTAPYTFTETGALPPGVVLNSSTGIFSGTPTASGTFNFSAVVTDSAGKKADKQLSIAIASASSSQVSVQVSPGTVTLTSGATQQFGASVSGTTNTSVVWSTTAGSISSTGLFTAGATTTTTTATVTATSVASSTVSGSATVTVNPAPSSAITVNVNPTSATVTSGGTQQFAASVSGTSNTSVIWSTTAGTISSAGLLTAPTVSATTPVTVTAKSAIADARSSASVSVTAPTTAPAPAVSISVSPGTVLLQPQGTVQFSAAVSGSSNTGVTWRAGFGTISSSGFYTAPASGTDTVIATSQADPTKSSSATITVQSSSGQNTGGGTGGTPNPAANAYCTASGTWSGAATDGPANLPLKCMYTPLSGTPSPGAVRGPDSSTTAVQNDLNAAACGDTILVAAGSTLGPITLPGKGCDNAHWITIQSTGVSNSNFPAEGVRFTPCWSGVASLRNRTYNCPSPAVLTFKIVAPNASNAIRSQGADHYRIIGAEITRVSTGGAVIYALVDLSSSGTQTNNIIFDRSWFEGIEATFPSTSQSTDTSTTRGLYLGQSNHVAVIDSYFTNFYDTSSMSANGNTDAQCMAGGFGNVANSGWGVYKFVNNHCEASGEGILLGGSSGPPLTPSGCTILVNCNVDTPSDIEVRQNYFFKPPQWNGNTTTPGGTGWPVVKNGFEMKTGVRGLFEGNVIENCWYNAQVCYSFSVAPINQQSGSGTPTCPTCVITDFTYRYNYSYNVAYGIGVYAFIPAGCPGCNTQGGHRISIHDNVIGDGMNLGNLSATSTGDSMEIMAVPDSTGLGLNQLDNVDISHNTFVRAIRSLAIFGGGVGQMRNLTLQNNIWAYGGYGFMNIGGSCDTPYAGNPYGMLNSCASTWTVDHNAVFNWNGGTLGAKWPTNGTGSGNVFVTGTSGIGFTNYGTGTSNFNPANYVLSTSSPLHNAASDGTDLGADINTLLTVISGVRQ